MSPRIAALTIAVVALFGLTACTGSPGTSTDADTPATSDQPGDEGQSAADACALIQQSIQDATAEFENASSSDPATVVDAMRAAAEQLSETARSVTNDEVAAIVPSLEDMFSEVAAVMEAIVKGDASKVQDLPQLGAKFQETSEAFHEICTP
ncbi:hypothetical protein SAMN04487846_1100 [Microbacterium sp. cf046]|uniref:hypothetical protein n=1 Tax=Microbacterium sp. cf046 TaxID=1761803 RepID=UPI0008F10360|nr:hypothetical protein [Microbacterium sp. cf046]SFR95123.1 hypothetical protein SAMN04487846_1100 [Microbacterium sp. cf046]